MQAVIIKHPIKINVAEYQVILFRKTRMANTRIIGISTTNIRAKKRNNRKNVFCTLFLNINPVYCKKNEKGIKK